MKLIKFFKNQFISYENIKSFTKGDAIKIARKIGIDFNLENFTLEEFTMGINVELEHGTRYEKANVTNNNPILTGKIAYAHLLEIPDYYTRLKKLEEEAKKYYKNIQK